MLISFSTETLDSSYRTPLKVMRHRILSNKKNPVGHP
jgi:hypothetical protein